MLSIQSHVVRGYVGNKSATFPLQVRTTGSNIQVILSNSTVQSKERGGKKASVRFVKKTKKIHPDTQRYFLIYDML